MVPKVFLDADVLYSRTLRAWLFNLAHRDRPSGPAFELIVSEDVVAEALARWRDNNPRVNGGVVANMGEQIREMCTVVRDYDCDIEFPGEDEGDIHVLAATIESRAGYLVTKDTGFHKLDEAVTDEFDFEISTPDDFFVLANDQSPQSAFEATRTMMRYFNNLGREPKLAEKLVNNDCPNFAQIVTGHLAVLAGARVRDFGRA